MLKLIVFDCDGVMFDSREANTRYYNDLLAHFSCPPMSVADESFVFMHNVADSVARIFRNYPAVTVKAVHEYRNSRDYGYYLSFMQMEADLVTFLDYCSDRFKLAISTNRTNTMQPLLEKYDLAKYFQLVVTAMDVARPKPAPDALEKILSFFKVTPQEAIFIGDSILDSQHAGSLKVPIIGFKNEHLPADYHVNSFMEILALSPFVEALNKSI